VGAPARRVTSFATGRRLGYGYPHGGTGMRWELVVACVATAYQQGYQAGLQSQ
jgi:hypothetical protein